MRRDYDMADCGHEIYKGEIKIWLDGKWLCQDCFEDLVMKMLNENPASLAEMMGGEIERVEIC